MNRVLGALKRGIHQVQMLRAPKAAILMYHRIADTDFDPWRLSVSPSHFAAHLEIIRQLANPMSLPELATAQRARKVPHRALVITFDDGYADNLHNAKPLLEQYSIPATVFVVSGALDADRELWWDELEKVLLQPGQLPEVLKLTINGRLLQWQLGAARYYSKEDRQRDHNLHPWESKPNARLAFYHNVWSALRELPTQKRQELQDVILNWAEAAPQARADYRTLTSIELLELERGGLVEIGAHTVSHPSLPAHPLEVQQLEIQECKEALERKLNHRIQSFAYPFGDLNHNSIKAAHESGFMQACSTVQQAVWKDSNPLLLPRFEVQNWKGDVFKRKLSQWLS